MTSTDKLENLVKEKQIFKNKIRNYKLERLGIMENVGLFTQPIVDEQKKTRAAINSIALGNTKQEILSIESSPKIRLEFQDTFHIDFRNIDQNLSKSIRPVFSQDGFKIGNAYIDVDREKRLMRVQGKDNAYAITQELVDLIKGRPSEEYDATHLSDYHGLANDVKSSVRCKRVKHLSGLVKKTGEGFSFLPDNIDELKARLKKLISAAEEGHSKVFNEGMAILKRLLEKKALTTQDFKNLTQKFSSLIKSMTTESIISAIEQLQNSFNNKFEQTIQIVSTSSDIRQKLLTPLQLDPSKNYKIALKYFATYNNTRC